jgi:hypothetical protein
MFEKINVFFRHVKEMMEVRTNPNGKDLIRIDFLKG